MPTYIMIENTTTPAMARENFVIIVFISGVITGLAQATSAVLKSTANIANCNLFKNLFFT